MIAANTGLLNFVKLAPKIGGLYRRGAITGRILKPSRQEPQASHDTLDKAQ